MNQHFASFCHTCNKIVDFWNDDITEYDVEHGFMVVKCPVCGHNFISSINVNDLMDVAEDKYGHDVFDYE